MKKLHILATLLAISTPAFSADLAPVSEKKVAEANPAPLWSGAYVGMNAGYGWGATTNTSVSSYPIIDQINSSLYFGTPYGFTSFANNGAPNVSQSGFIAGGQIGYNRQFYPQFVAGIEADMQGAAIRGTGGYTGVATSPGSFNSNFLAVGSGTLTAGVNWLGTVRGRVGYLFTPDLLTYATGGLAYGGVFASGGNILALSNNFGQGVDLFPVIPSATNYNSTRVGWTAGGGLEWLFQRNWSVKLEGLYYDLGSANISSGAVGAIDPCCYGPFIGSVSALNASASRVRYDGVIARAGLNYHIDFLPR